MGGVWIRELCGVMVKKGVSDVHVITIHVYVLVMEIITQWYLCIVFVLQCWAPWIGSIVVYLSPELELWLGKV